MRNRRLGALRWNRSFALIYETTLSLENRLFRRRLSAVLILISSGPWSWVAVQLTGGRRKIRVHRIPGFLCHEHVAYRDWKWRE